MKNATRGVTQKVGGSGERVSGVGGSLGREKGLEQIVETEHVEGKNVIVLAEAAILIASVEKRDSHESVSQNSKIMSPSQIGDIGGSNSTHDSQMSPPLSLVCVR